MADEYTGGISGYQVEAWRTGSSADEALDAIAAAHDAYAAERDAALPAGWDGPRPTAGVGGTRQGIKCLHAHYAWFLAGGPDPVGAWVADALAAGAGDRVVVS